VHLVLLVMLGLIEGMIYIDDGVMTRSYEVINQEGLFSYLTQEHLDRVRQLVKVSDKKHIPVIWKLDGIKQTYFMTKQYRFNLINLHHVLQTKNDAATAASLSPVSYATLTIPSVIAISYAGSLFLSLVENFVPQGPVKTTIKGAKVIVALPIGITETVINAIFGQVEKLVLKQALPSNVTAVYSLTDGPEIKNMTALRVKIMDWAKRLLRVAAKD